MTKNSFIETVQRQIEALFEAQGGASLTRTRRHRLAQILESACATLQNPVRPEIFTSRQVTILLADLRGFSALSESFPVAVILEVLNHYLSSMSENIVREGGTIDKFMGDSVMAIFGDPDPRKSVRNALLCAVKMQLSMDALNVRYRRDGLPELFMGIGINSGNVMAGKVGSALYSEYTVIGDDVNLVSRIEAFSLRGQILVSERTYDLSAGYIATSDAIEVHVKGKEEPVALREVLAIPSRRLKVPRREIRRSVRVKADLPISFHLLDGKIVQDRAFRGRLVDVSYFGLQVELRSAVDLHAELKLTLALPLVGYKANDIYARVQRVREIDGHTIVSLEISSASVQTLGYLRRFVQLLVQGSERV